MINEKEKIELKERITLILETTFDRLEKICQTDYDIMQVFFSNICDEKQVLKRYENDEATSNVSSVEGAIQILTEHYDFGLSNLKNIDQSASFIKSKEQWHSLTMDLISQQCFVIAGMTRRLEYYNLCVLDFNNFWGFNKDSLEGWLESFCFDESVEDYVQNLAYHIYSGSNIVTTDFFEHKESAKKKKGVAFFTECNSLTERCAKIICLLTRLKRFEVRSFLCDFLLSQLKIYKSSKE